MTLYSYAGTTLSSAVPLYALQEHRSEKTTPPYYTFRYLQSPPVEPVESDWLHHYQTKEGNLFLSQAELSGGLLLRFPNLADFVISKNLRQIGVWPRLNTDTESLQHLLLDQVLPRLLGHRGLLVLHASAVISDAGVIAFAGDTGRGKSTLAASFHSIGYDVICDDGLVVTPGESYATAQPIYPGLRLWPDSMKVVGPDTAASETMASYSSKRRVLVNEHSEIEPMPLAAIYILASLPLEDEQNQIAIARLSKRDACIELMRNSFRLHLSHQRQISNMLSTTGSITSQTPVFSLNYPRNYSYLSDVHEAIIECSDM